MGKLTFKFRNSFDMTIVADKEEAEAAVKAIVEVYDSAEFKAAASRPGNAKARVYTGLIAQAYKEHGLDAATAELIRFQLRAQLLELIRNEVSEEHIKVSPIRIQHLV